MCLDVLVLLYRYILYIHNPAFFLLNVVLDTEPARVYPYIAGMATGNPPYKVLQTDALKIALKVSRSPLKVY